MSRDLTPIYDVMPQEANQPAVVETTTQPAPNMAIAPNAIAPNNMVAPPNGGPLPPGLSLPPLGNVVPGQMPSLPNIPTTNELAKKVTEAQKESGPPVAPSALDQLDLKKHMHDFIESEHFWPTVGTGALALAGYGGAKAYQAYKKSKSVEERNIAKIEPSFGGGGTETITAAAEREMRDPIIKDGVRVGELKSFLNTDKLPTGTDLDLAVRSYLGTMGRTSIPPNVDLGSVMNFRPGEPVMGSTQATPDNVTGVDNSLTDFLKNKQAKPVLNPVVEATALNIPTFGEPKNAEQGGVEIPANSDPVHVKEEQDLSSAAQDPKERAQTITTAQTEVQNAIRPIDNTKNIFDETLPSSVQPEIKGAVAPKETKTAKATPPATPPVEIPEGRIPNYMEYKAKKGGAKEFKNKQGEDVIGKGGWNWYQSQVGPEVAQQNWEKAFGQTNQSYEEVKKAIAEGRLEGAPIDELGRGGKFGREPHVPKYIKGSATMKGMASTGLMAAMLGLAGSEKGQQAMEKASKAIKDLGISPDIFTNKAEELGNLGTSFVKAGGANYRAELNKQIRKEKNAARIMELEREKDRTR